MEGSLTGQDAVLREEVDEAGDDPRSRSHLGQRDPRNRRGIVAGASGRRVVDGHEEVVDDEVPLVADPLYDPDRAHIACDVSPIGVVERISAEWHFVIHDFLVTVEDPASARAGDDAAAIEWVPLSETRSRPGMVPGLVDFLEENGVLPDQ